MLTATNTGDQRVEVKAAIVKLDEEARLLRQLTRRHDKRLAAIATERRKLSALLATLRVRREPAGARAERKRAVDRRAVAAWARGHGVKQFTHADMPPDFSAWQMAAEGLIEVVVPPSGGHMRAGGVYRAVVHRPTEKAVSAVAAELAKPVVARPVRSSAKHSPKVDRTALAFEPDPTGVKPAEDIFVARRRIAAHVADRPDATFTADLFGRRWVPALLAERTIEVVEEGLYRKRQRKVG